jgi:two-component system nitrate/nitrite sensor histidine kinase NarX
MSLPRNLSAKLVGIQVFFLLVALVSIGLTLVVSWRLEGSAAAINDAGSLRMRTYRLAYLAEEAMRPAPVVGSLIGNDLGTFERIVATLKAGDPTRPLFVSRTPAIDAQFARLAGEWASFRPALERAARGEAAAIDRTQVERFVGVVNALVELIEADTAQATALLRWIQFALVALAIAGTSALIYLSFRVIIRPVHRLEGGLQRMAQGEFATRLPVESTDEFGALAAGFNDMAEHLEESYRHLETRVAEKTRNLAQQNARLATLYDMTTFLNAPTTQEDLCRGFLRRLLVTTGAAAGAVRLVSREGDTLHLFVEEGLPGGFAEKEHCLQKGECACGEAAAKSASVVHFMKGPKPPISVPLPHCREAGFAVVAAFPIAAHHQVLGIYNLFHREAHEIASEERHMLESLGQHLGVAIESLRLASSARELAIAEERNLLAQELHDSIAQALAFLNLQVQMLRQSLAGGRADEAAKALEEIQAGVQESYADVRELLVHFRTRLGEGDVEHGIRTLLAKFQQQTAIPAELHSSGATVPLAPDDQLQVMHILQEALSNVRKHSRAKRVDVVLTRGPGYTFTVRDDGCGFDAGAAEAAAGDHVGLKIMQERASRIGGALTVRSSRGAGTEVVLRLPLAQKQAA